MSSPSKATLSQNFRLRQWTLVQSEITCASKSPCPTTNAHAWRASLSPCRLLCTECQGSLEQSLHVLFKDNRKCWWIKFRKFLLLPPIIWRVACSYNKCWDLETESLMWKSCTVRTRTARQYMDIYQIAKHNIIILYSPISCLSS